MVGCGLAELAIRRGGHVRVGLEDWAGAGEPSNLDLLRALVDLAERLGRQPATIRDARRILGIGQPATPRVPARGFTGATGRPRVRPLTYAS